MSFELKIRQYSPSNRKATCTLYHIGKITVSRPRSLDIWSYIRKMKPLKWKKIKRTQTEIDAFSSNMDAGGLRTGCPGSCTCALAVLPLVSTGKTTWRQFVPISLTRGRAYGWGTYCTGTAQTRCAGTCWGSTIQRHTVVPPSESECFIFIQYCRWCYDVTWPNSGPHFAIGS